MKMYTVGNRAAFEYNCSYMDAISEICSLLLDNTPLTTFGYRKFFADGTFVALSNKLEWEKYYYNHVHSPGRVFGDAICNANENGFSYLVWPSEPKESIFQALCEKNIWHGLTIYLRGENYVESFAFAGNRDDEQILRMYNSKTIRELEHFISYFKSMAHEIIMRCEKEGRGRFKNFQATTKEALEQKFADGQIAEQLPLNKITIKTDTCEVSLSRREWLCLKKISEGMMAKEIAVAMGLSVRTIESYISRIKQKTKLSRKADLIKLFYLHKKEWS